MASERRKFVHMEQAASLASTFLFILALLAQKSPSSFVLEGQGEAAGSDRPRGRENFTITARIAAHY